MIVASSRAELVIAREKLASAGGPVGVVMTMGALHAGHLRLIEAARKRADRVIVTIFVNPLQFGPSEDFDRYPRTLDDDLAMCASAGVDVVFVPHRIDLYPDGEPRVRVEPGPLGAVLEGASRPGFFHGVLTVVLKLLNLTRPDVAFFGEKDYQQLTLVRRLVRDVNLPVEVVGVPIVREPDGLARSSRNRYLNPADRRAALVLSRALRAGAEQGPAGARAVLAQAHRVLAEEPVVCVDYLVLTDPELGPPPPAGPARLLIAARVGGTRLIDNVPLEIN